MRLPQGFDNSQAYNEASDAHVRALNHNKRCSETTEREWQHDVTSSTPVSRMAFADAPETPQSDRAEVYLVLI